MDECFAKSAGSLHILLMQRDWPYVRPFMQSFGCAEAYGKYVLWSVGLVYRSVVIWLSSGHTLKYRKFRLVSEISELNVILSLSYSSVL